MRVTAPFLYKYGSAKHLEWLEPIIRQHQLYFPSPKQLNDPKEAKPPLKVSSRQGVLSMMVNAFLTQHARDPYGQLARDVRNMKAIVNTGTLEDLAEFMTPALHKPLEEHRIYSMTTRSDNDHLWNEYADHHAGYCLEFETRGGPFCFAVHVIYEEEVAIDLSDPDDLDWKFLIRKTPGWKVEEEVRILLLPRGQPHDVPFDPTLLKRIILGKNMAVRDRLTIQEWCQTRVPVLQASDE